MAEAIAEIGKARDTAAEPRSRARLLFERALADTDG